MYVHVIDYTWLCVHASFYYSPAGMCSQLAKIVLDHMDTWQLRLTEPCRYEYVNWSRYYDKMVTMHPGVWINALMHIR